MIPLPATTSENGRATMAPIVIVALSLLFLLTGDAPSHMPNEVMGERNLGSSLVEREYHLLDVADVRVGHCSSSCVGTLDRALNETIYGSSL
jgi:hypothetical protein